mmetsp:Transcript_48275/g.94323  ORF Transcript_48275/g.94323 Transcript_48275/m.94323 type:complete len:133 (-) Transcript_48275:2081-2479(-)
MRRECHVHWIRHGLRPEKSLGWTENRRIGGQYQRMAEPWTHPFPYQRSLLIDVGGAAVDSSLHVRADLVASLWMTGGSQQATLLPTPHAAQAPTSRFFSYPLVMTWSLIWRWFWKMSAPRFHRLIGVSAQAS